MVCRKILRIGAAALTLIPFASCADEDSDWFDFRGEYSCDIASAYISRAKIYEDRPIQINEITVDMGLGPFGRIGLWYWNYSSLTGRCQDKHRRFVPEQNYAAFYDYDIKFSENWTLANEVMVEWQTFHGEKPENSPASYEWRVKQTLKNPYVTPYWKGRFTIDPLAYNYYQIGLKRSFKPSSWVKLTPHVAIDLADKTGVKKRFGLDDARAGALSLIGEITAEFPITDYFSLHATVGQFGKINDDGRANSKSPNHSDLTYGQVGFTLSF